MELLNRLKIRLEGDLNPPSDALLTEYLLSARASIMNRLYPYRDTQELPVPTRYIDLQLRMAMELVAKTGAEGETGHSEDGVSRHYDSAGFSRALLAEIIPFVGVSRAPTSP